MSDQEKPQHPEPIPVKHIIIIIDDDTDLELRLHQILNHDDEEETFTNTKGEQQRGTIVATMKVKRQVLVDNSEVFKSLLWSGRWDEAKNAVVDQECPSIESVQLVLRVLHGTWGGEFTGISTEVVYELLHYCDFWGIGLGKLKVWYTCWVNKINIEDLKDSNDDHNTMRQLLFPAYTFNDAKSFALLTKRLVYEMSEPISEYNPTLYRHLRLHNNVVGSANGARGSLRSKMLRGLFDPVSAFLGAGCECKKESLYAFMIGLSKTGIWPLHDAHKKSLLKILNCHGFENFECDVPENACEHCIQKISPKSVNTVRESLLTEFDGLCLDCMNLTKTGDVNDDYWEHGYHRDYSSGCRVDHGEPTWYFSFMGRRQDMKKHQDELKQRRENERAKRSRFSGRFGRKGARRYPY